MLTPVEDGPAIVACNTCRHSADAKEDMKTQEKHMQYLDASASSIRIFFHHYE